jgi:hypothetical protein
MVVATKEDFDSLSAEIYQDCRKYFQRDGKVPPTILALTLDEAHEITDRVVILVNDLMREGVNRDVVISMYNDLSETFDLVAFVSEAWTLPHSNERDCRISEHPDRQEVVMVMLRSRDYETGVKHPIDRKQNDLIQKTIDHANTKVGGRFARTHATQH